MSLAQKTFSQSRAHRSFIELVKHQDSTATHVVRTYDDQQRPCWFMLKAHERNLVKLERTAYNAMIDLTQFGEVIASGWGHEPD